MDEQENDAFKRGVFEGQVLAILDRIERSVTDIKSNNERDHKTFEVRLTKLESWRYWLLGAFAVIAVLATFTKDYIIDSII